MRSGGLEGGYVGAPTNIIEPTEREVSSSASTCYQSMMECYP